MLTGMAGLTLATAEAKLAELIAAHTAIASGQRVEMDGRTLARANLAEVQAGIEFWDGQCKRLTSTAAGRGRIARVVSARG